MSTNYDLKTIDQILALPNSGEFLMEVHDKHEALIEQMTKHVDETNKDASGTFTVKLSYKLDRSGMFQIAAEVAVKEPKKPVATAVAWQGSKDGRITPANPAQLQMDIRDVSEERREIR